MPTFVDHPDIACAECGYEFRKNDRFIFHDDIGKVVCEAEKKCRRRQNRPAVAPTNPTFDQMIERVAARLQDDVKTHLLMASEHEGYLRALWERSYDKRDGRYVTITDPWGPQR